jgi:hypothetical protein
MTRRSPSPTRSLATRVGSMALLWLGLGAVVGILSAPPDGGIIGFAAGATAGMIVLPAFGAPLGLFGGRWRESLMGAVCGFSSGIAVTLFGGGARAAPSVSLHLVFGAGVGATLPQLGRLHLRLAGQVWAQLRSFRTERPAASSASPYEAVNP